MNKEVKVYSTPTCPYCIQVKQFLRDNGIEFKDIDVSANPGELQYMVEKSGQLAVPVVDIDGEFIIGFDKDKISRVLGISEVR